MNRIVTLAICTTLLGFASTASVEAQGRGAIPIFNPKLTVIIDYIDGFPHHRDGHDGGPPGGGNGGGNGGDEVDHSNGHYELIGGTWPDADGSTSEVDPQLDFVVDLRGFPVGSDTAIEAGFAAWELETKGDLVGSISYADVAVGFGDDLNTYSMRNLGGGVLAVTFLMWDDANDDNEINNGESFLETDVIHNSTVKWGTDEEEPNGIMWWDVQNVAAHEIGHVFGLAHPGTAHDEDEEQTMFESAQAQETKKRTLEANGDIPGIQDSLLGYEAP